MRRRRATGGSFAAPRAMPWLLYVLAPLQVPGPLPPPHASAQAAAAGGEPDVDAAKALAAEIGLLRARRALRTLGLIQDLADLLMVLAEVSRRQRGLVQGMSRHGWRPAGAPPPLPLRPPRRPAPTTHRAASVHSARCRQVRPRKGGLMNHGAVLALAGLLSGCLSAYKAWPSKGPG